MRTGSYSRMAMGNLKKNARLYVPRVLAESGLLGCFYIMLTLAMDERMEACLGGSHLSVFMQMGVAVLGLLSLVLILYINSFLMKQRRGEYGLYTVLGMEKRHVARVLFWESSAVSAVSLGLGAVFGMLFYKLASLLICRLFRTQVVAGFYYLDAVTVLIPVGVYAALDAAAFLVNCLSLRRLKPVELMRDKHTGEKEPRVKWLLLVIGALSLGAGYYISLTTRDPLSALLLFFAAVILVIAGTYCLFVSGTTFVLKCLRRNKKYYYQKRHMPAVAGLLFRMKQNAVGLASIAILATGVLVMISTTVSLYSGVEDTLNSNYASQLYLSAYDRSGEDGAPVSPETLSDIVTSAAAEVGVEIESIRTERYLSVTYADEGGTLKTAGDMDTEWATDDLTAVTFITNDTYSQLEGMKIGAQGCLDLAGDEIAYCRISSTLNDLSDAPKTVTVGGKSYKVKEILGYFPVYVRPNGIARSVGIVVSDEETLSDIYRAQKESLQENASEYTGRVCVNFQDEEAATAKGKALGDAVYERLEAEYPRGFEADLDSKWDAKDSLLGMYGSFLFLGILLGSVCLFATILIIYYKQIAEGYEDRPRFQIMEKIGMETAEVKRTVAGQLILQFMLPLVTAGVHTAMAFPILLKLLKVLMLTNTALFVGCTAVTFAVFTVVYVAVYLLTARTYYKIVH